jgi:type I restriction enzyme, S subunit
MRKYGSYKDSGINWVQEIPNHWSKNKFKFLFNEKKSTPNPSLNSGSISFGEVIYKDDESIPESTKLSYQEVLEGEFLINPLNLNYDLKSLRISRSKINVVVSQGYIVLQLVSKDNPEYFRFLLRDFDIRHLKSLGSGVRQTISFTHLKSEELPLPPLSEQQQIVSYLDRKTSQIDSLIEKTQRKIELLNEKRTSLINEVVTKGLNPNVEMKDSGVEWIGEIPISWKTSKLGFYTTKIGSGSTPRGGSEVYVDSGIPFIRSQNVHFDGLRLNDVSFIEYEVHNSMKGSTVVKNDVLLNITGGSIGRCCVVDIEGEMNVNQHVSIIRTTHDLENYFLNYILSCDLGQSQVRYNLTGGNREGLTIEGIRDFQITIPPLSEQQQIVEYLDEQTQKIDKTVSNEERRIELLKEYRQSLISEVVTGKRKVISDE